ATIGLEEAVLLTVLNDAASLQSQAWARLGKQALRQQLPFWDDVTIRRILQNLLDKGLLTLSGPMFPDAEGLMFSFTPPAGQPQAPPGHGNHDEPAGSTAGQPEATTPGTLAPQDRNPAAAATARHSGQFQLEPAGCLFIAGPRAGRQPQRLERALFPPCKKPV